MSTALSPPIQLGHIVLSSAELGVLAALGEGSELLARWRLPLTVSTSRLVLDGLLARGALVANGVDGGYVVASAFRGLFAPILTASVEIEAVLVRSDLETRDAPAEPVPGVRAIIGLGGVVEHAQFPDGLHELRITSAEAVAGRVIAELGLGVERADEPGRRGELVQLTTEQLGVVTERLATDGVAAAEEALPQCPGYACALASSTGIATVDVHVALTDDGETPLTATLSWLDGGAEGCWTVAATEDGVTVCRVPRAILAKEITALIAESDLHTPEVP